MLSARQVAGTAYFYINGIAQGSGAVGAVSASTTNDLKIGEKSYVGSSIVNFNGVMDEVQISNSSYSDSWMKANYLSQSDAFITYSSVQKKTLGTVTVTAQLNSTSSATVTMPFTITGTASNTTDHNATSGSIRITAGKQRVQMSCIFIGIISPRVTRPLFRRWEHPRMLAGATNVHTVTLVDEVNLSPFANTDVATITNLSATSIAVLSNDTDANSDPLSVTSVTQGIYGTDLVKISGSGN